MMKNHNDTVFVPEVPTIKESNQTTHDVIEPTPTAEETNSELSELMLSQKRIVLFKLNWKRSFAYTKQTMIAYMSEEDLNRLCTYIAEYSTNDTLQKISPVKVDSQLKSIDITHFVWNIGKAFGRKCIHTATFIKNVFAHSLCDVEISTIERKMSHTESVCRIKLDVKIV